MIANVHPSSSELLAAQHDPDCVTAAPTLEHLEECLACRVRLARIRRASGPDPASANSLQRIIEASTPLPEALAAIALEGKVGEPQPNEIWRIGRSEALLVWVRRVFEDGIADVIPLVLDVELADQESVVLSADATPLATETAAMVSLRTHVHTGAFLNRVAILDIGEDVTEVMTAMRESRRPSKVRVGPPIDDDDDQRLEYRQALRDLLAELAPSAWLDTQDGIGADTKQSTSEPTANSSPDGLDQIKADLGERLRGAQICDLHPHRVTVDEQVQATSLLKVVYLDTAVLVAALSGGSLTAFPEIRVVAAACQQLTLIEKDADAVAMAIPHDDWPTLLFTTAHMRSALVLPGGAQTGPTVTLEGLGLVDTLCKHLEGAMPAWEVTERASGRIARAGLHQIAARHASMSIAQITAEAKRAHQIAKRTAWGSLPDKLDERVARFVVAVANQEAIDDALAELALETRND
ncbi:hypothetical protein Psi02_15350 [Planotetraspora silvatica]|uniref:Uncharacterized protein n=1 Tax=Planotetraspora silvatica TaxID=234614 RepID=A0A8J3XME2_9ACTN|nr:hypothetical protein [Planotetraspora silvatica]GII45111.1 hypothetical protein Psi02_15350 [Planotetraspora silvatica]